MGDSTVFHYQTKVIENKEIIKRSNSEGFDDKLTFVYPNPAVQTDVNIRVKFPTSGMIIGQIYYSTGRLLKQISFPVIANVATDYKWISKNVPSGNYIIKLSMKSESIILKAVVIN